jgi:hypothetical protein
MSAATTAKPWARTISVVAAGVLRATGFDQATARCCVRSARRRRPPACPKATQPSRNSTAGAPYTVPVFRWALASCSRKPQACRLAGATAQQMFCSRPTNLEVVGADEIDIERMREAGDPLLHVQGFEPAVLRPHLGGDAIQLAIEMLKVRLGAVPHPSPFAIRAPELNLPHGGLDLRPRGRMDQMRPAEGTRRGRSDRTLSAHGATRCDRPLTARCRRAVSGFQPGDEASTVRLKDDGLPGPWTA